MKWASITVLFSLLAAGCAHKTEPSGKKTLPARATAMAYSIQAGAFSRVENAVRFTRFLESKGIQAFYYAHSSGLYKVRFGDYPSREKAESVARGIRDSGFIEDYMIIGPGEYASARGKQAPSGSIRDELARTAQSFVGIPYQWGSSSPGKGLDCSGLVLAVYQLNGLSVPRTSQEQYSGGTPVFKSSLGKGDLVFFATGSRRIISHVGIYIGNDVFIHAPGAGKAICIESLSSDYFRDRFMGARTYLR